MPYTDLDKRRVIRKKWKNKNKKFQKDKEFARKEEKRKWLNDYKQTLVCFECGFDFFKKPECLDFHHFNPNKKENTISRMVLRVSRERLSKELEKCIPLCACCHRTIHVLSPTS